MANFQLYNVRSLSAKQQQQQQQLKGKTIRSGKNPTYDTMRGKGTSCPDFCRSVQSTETQAHSYVVSGR